MKKLLFVLVAVLPLACSDDDQNAVDYDYVVFGDYYGECGNNCVSIFKLESNKLFADELRAYPKLTEPYEGDYTQVSGELYNEVKDLPSDIPYATLKAGDKIVGEPDAGDWGGIYLEVSVDGEVDYWFLDKKQDNLPNNLKNPVAEINEKLTALKAGN